MSHLRAIHILGSSASLPPADTSSLSPEALSNLDRALTPAEQKRVDDWQAGVSDRMQKDEEAKGGPTATANVTAKGATVAANKAPGSLNDPYPVAPEKKPLIAAPVTPEDHTPFVLAGVGLAVVSLLGILYVVIRRK